MRKFGRPETSTRDLKFPDHTYEYIQQHQDTRMPRDSFRACQRASVYLEAGSASDLCLTAKPKRKAMLGDAEWWAAKAPKCILIDTYAPVILRRPVACLTIISLDRCPIRSTFVKFLPKPDFASNQQPWYRHQTYRRQMEIALTKAQQESISAEQAFAMLVANISDYAIYILDLDGNVTSWNAGAQKIKGYTAEEIIGQNFSRFYLREDVESGKPFRNLNQAAETGHCEEENWRVRKDGSRFLANVVITPLYSPTGKHIGFSKITRDLTGRQVLLEMEKRRSSELEQLTNELREANSAMEAFSYSVSHDLRAPLRAMWGFADALLEDYGHKLDDTGRQYADAILEAAKSMDHLIDDLLSYSRLARTDMQLGPVRLNDAVRDAEKQILGNFSEIGAKIESDFPLPEVRAHYTTLVQVLANLLSNALKFVEKGVKPEIFVRPETKDQTVRLWVEDNGIGIDPAHQKQVFAPFERLHGNETYPGTGIGLAIVRKALERMGGQCGVESQLGRGSRFWIELPKGQS